MKYTEVDEHNKEQQKGVILYMYMSCLFDNVTIYR